MRNLSKILFYGCNLYDVLESNLQITKTYVDELPETNFIGAEDGGIVEHVFSKFQVMPIDLHEDAKELEKEEIEVDVRGDWNRAIIDNSRPAMVPGLKIIVSIPFSGDPLLWKCQPSTYTLNPPRANVQKDPRNDEGGHIEIILECPSDAINNAKIKQEIESIIKNIHSYLGTISGDVEAHNRNLLPCIQGYVAARRQRLGKHAELAKVLDIPLKKKPGAPDVSNLPIKRRLVKSLPSAPNKQAEPGISDENYQNILMAIRHVGCTFEGTPKTYAVHDEGELRDIMLASLNAFYQGSATGETFRKKGKTDIRIEDQNRAAFVGECKVWRGPNEVTEALHQLLGYLTWRDCKAALIVFNKEVSGFTAIQSKVPETIKAHSKFICEEKSEQTGEWRFLFHSADDDDRHIIIHVFLFNLYFSSDDKSV